MAIYSDTFNPSVSKQCSCTWNPRNAKVHRFGLSCLGTETEDQQEVEAAALADSYEPLKPDREYCNCPRRPFPPIPITSTVSGTIVATVLHFDIDHHSEQSCYCGDTSTNHAQSSHWEPWNNECLDGKACEVCWKQAIRPAYTALGVKSERDDLQRRLRWIEKQQEKFDK